MPMFMGGNIIKFHYNFGGYNNSLKIQPKSKFKSQIHFWFSYK